jgi:hypothetical protein
MTEENKNTETLESSTKQPLFIDGVKASTYIICSAIWFNDSKEHNHQPKNIKSGFVISGRRHHNCYASFQSIGKSLGYDKTLIVKKGVSLEERETQGFLTNTDLFVDRNRAGKIAFLANQTRELKTRLFSEDLY